jgi:hypothetical protein
MPNNPSIFRYIAQMKMTLISIEQFWLISSFNHEENAFNDAAGQVACRYIVDKW